MKKIICLLLAMVTVFAFVSCGEPCEVHVDDNSDGKCDVCEATIETPDPECTEHVDENEDGKCDVCDADVETSDPECTEHADENEDGKCDVCGEDMPEAPAMTYAEFIAAEMNSEVTVITYVQAKQAWWYDSKVESGKGTFYTQSPDGAYFVYEMLMTAEEYNALTPGTCIIVNGFKSAWSGEVEITDATYEIVADAESFIAEPIDITDALVAGTDVIDKQNFLVSINYATVVAPALYKWDGSGSEGDDLYLTVKVGNNEYAIVVESYFHANGSAAIAAYRFFGASVKWISVFAANRLRTVRSAIGTL